MIASGKKGKMAVIKKRSVSVMEKRTNNLISQSEQLEDMLLEDQRAGNPNDMLVDMNDMDGLVIMGDEVGDPDIVVLARQEEELIHDDVIDLKNPVIAAELSEDPVRLYLGEIGRVKLLDSDSEFRLATLIEADRLANALKNHPLRKGLT